MLPSSNPLGETSVSAATVTVADVVSTLGPSLNTNGGVPPQPVNAVGVPADGWSNETW